MPTPCNHGAGFVAPGDSTGAQNGIFLTSSSSPCSRTVSWSRHLFSPTKIPHVDGAVSFIAKQGLDPLVSEFLPLVQCNCECHQSTPLALASSFTQPKPRLLHSLRVENLSTLPHPSLPLTDSSNPPHHNPNPYQPSMATLLTQDKILRKISLNLSNNQNSYSKGVSNPDCD